MIPVVTLFLSALFFAACAPAQQPEITPATDTESMMEETMQQPDSGTETMMDDSIDDTTQDSEAQSGRELFVETAYMSPAGEEKVAFMVTVDEEGIIIDANTNVLAKSPISVTRQESFASDLPTAITGKKLSELTQIDRVGGSSLTTGAFNESLEDLKAQL